MNKTKSTFKEKFTEELFIRQAPTGHIYNHFRFITIWDTDIRDIHVERQYFIQGVTVQYSMTVCFWYLVKSDLSSAHVYSCLHWTSNFLQGTRKTRPCFAGHPVALEFSRRVYPKLYKQRNFNSVLNATCQCSRFCRIQFLQDSVNLQIQQYCKSRVYLQIIFFSNLNFFGSGVRKRIRQIIE